MVLFHKIVLQIAFSAAFCAVLRFQLNPESFSRAVKNALLNNQLSNFAPVCLSILNALYQNSEDSAEYFYFTCHNYKPPKDFNLSSATCVSWAHFVDESLHRFA